MKPTQVPSFYTRTRAMRASRFLLTVVALCLSWSASPSVLLAQCDWLEEQKLTASDGAADDRFGWSVSISGSVAKWEIYAVSSATA